jgi:CheY-like chemotaxis protein
MPKTNFIPTLKAGSPVAVVDDDREWADLASDMVEEAGFAPTLISPESIPSIDSLLSAVQKSAEAVVCDHRLKSRGYAAFQGAEAVARLYEQGVPSILVTGYVMDADVSIRLWRRSIPVLLLHSNISPEEIRDGFLYCVQELQGKYSTEREPVRTLIRVEDTTKESDEEVVDAVIPAWSGDRVRFPVRLIGDEYLGKAQSLIGRRFFAKVNIGATKSQDLYLTGFEAAAQE